MYIYIYIHDIYVYSIANVKIIFSRVTLLDLVRNLIDWKAISRFILNSHAAALQGCRRATTVVTPTEARDDVRGKGKSEEGKGRDPVAYSTRCCAHTDARTRGTSILTCDRGKGSLPLSSPGDGVPVLGQTSHAAHQVRGLCVI